MLAADQGRAGELLASLPTQALVRHFAPHAWLPLQQGRLHLLRGDGAQADKELAEVARLTSDAQRPELLAIRAQAQVLAGEHTKAHQFLSALKGKSELRPHDQLALGIALLHTRNKPEEASEHIEAAREVLGGHPRVLAGLAYARARAGDAVAASELLERAQEVLDDETHHDEVVADLVRRTEKALRAFRKTEAKRGRKRDRRRRGADAQQGRAETEVVAAEPRSESADANTAGPEEAKATEAEEPHARKIQEAKAKAATEEVREAAKEVAKSTEEETADDVDADEGEDAGSKKEKKARGRKARKQKRRAARKKQKAEERAKRRAAERAAQGGEASGDEVGATKPAASPATKPAASRDEVGATEP
ncbi:MAG: hypothetical protein KC668_12880, partial [Myxococcales bacterium]|nr:hypothetical protein [Myxococcales bacterium]